MKTPHYPPDQPRVWGLETEYGFHPAGILDFSLPDGVLPFGLRHAGAGYLSNGARLYPDQGKNIEYATPECNTIPGILAAHFAGEVIVGQVVPKVLSPGHSILKHTIDSDYNCRGEHENYMIFRSDTAAARQLLITHLVTRQVITGPGMIIMDNNTRQARYSLDQKVWDMGGSPVSNNSTERGKKPFVLARDEGFDQTYTTDRLQVVSGSHNRLAFPIAARLATTSLVLRLIEAGMIPYELRLAEPQYAAHFARQISLDTDLELKIPMAKGEPKTAVEVQLGYAELCVKLASKRRLLPEETRAAEVWADTATSLKEKRFDDLTKQVEWIAKRRRLQAFCDRLGIGLSDPETRMRDIRWHTLTDSPEHIINRLRSKNSIACQPDDTAVRKALTTPPDNTRARLRANDIAGYTPDMTGRPITWSTWFTPSGQPREVNDARQGC